MSVTIVNAPQPQSHDERVSRKIQTRRPTMMPPKSKMLRIAVTKSEKGYHAPFKWWQKPSIVYAFSHPHVRSRLEKLMGSNLVSLTDRGYMQKLQERILEEYDLSMTKRIKTREDEERVRVKDLVLTGKIPLDDAPEEMANHPVMLIEMYCRRVIAERRAKMRSRKPRIRKFLYPDDTPDPPSGLSIEKGHRFRKGTDRLCNPPEKYLMWSDEEDIERGYMFTQEDYDKLKYEDPLIKELRACETVEEMYALADEIIGILKTVAATDDVSMATTTTTTTTTGN